MAWTNAVWADHQSVRRGDLLVIGGASGYVLTSFKTGKQRLVRMETMLACVYEWELFFEAGMVEHA